MAAYAAIDALSPKWEPGTSRRLSEPLTVQIRSIRALF